MIRLMFHLLAFSIPSVIVVIAVHLAAHDNIRSITCPMHSYHQTTSARSGEGANSERRQIEILASRAIQGVFRQCFQICNLVQLFKCSGLFHEEEMFSRASWEFFWFAFNCFLAQRQETWAFVADSIDSGCCECGNFGGSQNSFGNSS